jgi:K+-transporting ATPase KdpF subunit
MAPTLGFRRQDRVNASQGDVNAAGPVPRESLTGTVIENLVAALLGVALLAYLVYALVRPERF